MSLNLTPSEIKLADGLITGLEKRSRAHKWGRWVGLITGVVFLGLGIFAYFFGRWFYGQIFINDFLGWIIDGRSYDPESVKIYIDTRVMFVFMYMMSIVQMMVSGIIGGAFVVFTLATWNRHRRDALIAKVLRAEFDRERALSKVLK